MQPLPLFGTATLANGFQHSESRSVVRLTSLSAHNLSADHDFVLTRNADEVARAKSERCERVILISENAEPVDVENVKQMIVLPPRFEYLAEGDIIGIQHSTRKFRTLFRSHSKHNSFLVTERCNNYCLMCSQPPKDVDDEWILDEISESLPLLDKRIPALTFTGGEPLTNWPKFVDILSGCRDQLPNTAIQVLTNGRAFATSQIVDAWRAVKHPSLIAAIPVYSSVDHVHDYVVQAKGAFDETILGILKLKDRGQAVEIRVVLHALTAPNIAQTCRWFARNLPFVDHVALMGLENTGFAIANDELLWIDPVDYREALAEAVSVLTAARVNVSVYNLPRCVIDPAIWPNAVQSISDWKNGYVEQCDGCIEKVRCSGFFTSGRPRLSRGITPILA